MVSWGHCFGLRAVARWELRGLVLVCVSRLSAFRRVDVLLGFYFYSC